MFGTLFVKTWLIFGCIGSWIMNNAIKTQYSFPNLALFETNHTNQECKSQLRRAYILAYLSNADIYCYKVSDMPHAAYNAPSGRFV